MIKGATIGAGSLLVLASTNTKNLELLFLNKIIVSLIVVNCIIFAKNKTRFYVNKYCHFPLDPFSYILLV
jgi:hypothetical protein